jgi:hypothetical protein
MKKRKPTRRNQSRRRQGLMSLEVVMTIGIMVPVAGILFFVGIKMCAAAYEAISAMVSWPFL